MMNEIAKNSNSNTYVIEMSTISYFEIIIILLVDTTGRKLRLCEVGQTYLYSKSQKRVRGFVRQTFTTYEKEVFTY